MIEIKVVRNVILNNIDLHDQPSRMHRSPPRSRQNFPDSKNSKIDKSETDISDLIIECFDQDKSYQKIYFKQLISLWNCLFCTVLPPGAFKVDQTHKFDDFKNIVPSDFIVQLYNRIKSFQKYHFKQHWYPWCIVLPSVVANIFQIRKIQELQLFPMTPYIVLVEIKVVGNYVSGSFCR